MCRISIAPFPLPKPAMAVTVMYRQRTAKRANDVRTIPRRAFGGRASSFLRTLPFKPSMRVFIFPIRASSRNWTCRCRRI